MSVSSVGMTDIGLRRVMNQDTFVCAEGHHLYIVADGMGGGIGGEVASRMAVDTVCEFYATHTAMPESEDKLAQAIRQANQKIYEAGEQSVTHKGMGTTIVAIVALPSKTIVGYVGDSRIYQCHDGKCLQVTVDHSLVNDYIKMGFLSPKAATSHPTRHVLSRALGPFSSVEVDVFTKTPTPGDLFLLCSDGLTNQLSNDEIGTILKGDDLNKVGQTLIDRAKETGGKDNITVVLVRYD